MLPRPARKGEENQPSSYHMLEVPLEAAALGKDVDNKYMEEGKTSVLGEAMSDWSTRSLEI